MKKNKKEYRTGPDRGGGATRILAVLLPPSHTSNYLFLFSFLFCYYFLDYYFLSFWNFVIILIILNFFIILFMRYSLISGSNPICSSSSSIITVELDLVPRYSLCLSHTLPWYHYLPGQYYLSPCPPRFSTYLVIHHSY